MIIFKTLFLKFILLPLIAFLLLGLLILVQKKNEAANNKKLIIYILIAGILLSLPGIAGMAGNTFNPYWYLFAQTIYLFLGVVHVNLLNVYFKSDKNSKAFTILYECLITLISMILGAYLFTVIFNLLSPSEGFAWMAATAIFIFSIPLIFYYTWIQFTAIPLNIYKIWVYNEKRVAVNFEGADFNKLMIINVDFTKKLEDGNRFVVQAKSPETITLGDWFYRFIEDYNLKFPQQPVEMGNKSHGSFGWIFYTKPSFFHWRRYLDYEKSISANKITEKVIIICKRVIEQEEEKLVPIQKGKFNN